MLTETNKHIPSEQEIKRWLVNTSKGDQAAFTFLLRYYWNKVYSQALTYLKSAEHAQEVTQDVFVKIWSSKERLAEIENFSDYLFIISRNEVISALRKRREANAAFVDDVEELILQPDKQLLYKEAYHKILSLIEQMPATRKTVFKMSRLDGKSYEEIGRALGISRNGVKDHIVKALNFLRTNLGPGEGNFLSIAICAALLFQ
ncbi:RNA polymerase sigma-70 factor [Chitinophagaceae bacterium 26-R-25]|nr:RNA polymerase sigma-70 factor [Chitinophagaceae bacterium 26-R-25]